MGGVPINHQFGTIQICQFGKCTGKPIINENNQYPKDLILAADIMKNHQNNDSGRCRQRRIHQITKIQEKIKSRD